MKRYRRYTGKRRRSRRRMSIGSMKGLSSIPKRFRSRRIS